MSSYALRAFRGADAAKVNELALAAFDQFQSEYSDWPAMASAIGRISVLADTGDIIVAERDERIIGAVAYIAAGRPKAAYFDQSWPINPRDTGVGLPHRAANRPCKRNWR